MRYFDYITLKLHAENNQTGTDGTTYYLKEKRKKDGQFIREDYLRNFSVFVYFEEPFQSILANECLALL